MDSREYIAEIYTCDKQLLATLNLGEGRQRFEADECESPSKDSGALKIVPVGARHGRHEAAGGAREATVRSREGRSEAAD